MLPFGLLLVLAFGCETASGQKSKMLLKSWIVTGIYLPDSSKMEDTTYLRYTFDRNKCYVSLLPDWNENPLDWSRSDDLLTIGVVIYHIDRLTDSTLILSSPGFRTMTMEDEICRTRDSTHLRMVATINGEPVYQANHFITPRYKKGDLYKFIGEKYADISIVKASTFRASFVVHKDGSVSDIKLIQGIFEDLDNIVLKAIGLTSKEWAPATFNGTPVNTQVIYTIRYLDSPTAKGY